MTEIQSILYVFLPCRPVYPVGPMYLANKVHEKYPRIRQNILDLSLIPRKNRYAKLMQCMNQQDPQLVCFSWRDIQVFAPHEGDPSLKYAFNFFYSPNPLKKLVASIKGLQYLWIYHRGIQENLSYPTLIRKKFPNRKIMVGGGAFSVFADQLINRLPEGTIGIIGEAEEALVKTIEGKDLSVERSIIRKGSTIYRGVPGAPPDRSLIPFEKNSLTERSWWAEAPLVSLPIS